MAERIIYCFESIKIKVRYRQLLSASDRLHHRLVQTIGEQHPIRDTGQRVVVRN